MAIKQTAEKTKASKNAGLGDMEFEDVVLPEIIKLKKGEHFIGRLTMINSRPWTDKTTGEVKTLPQYHFETPNLEKIIYFGDAGFVNTFSMAGIEIGEMVKVTKLEKAEMSGGRTVNQYAVARARPH